MIATDFRGGADCPKQVRTQFHMRWCPDEQIAWRWRVTLPETPAMPQTERLASRRINGSIQTLLNLLQVSPRIPQRGTMPPARSVVLMSTQPLL